MGVLHYNFKEWHAAFHIKHERRTGTDITINYGNTYKSKIINTTLNTDFGNKDNK